MKNSIKIAFLALIISISTSAMDAPLPAKAADSLVVASSSLKIEKGFGTTYDFVSYLKPENDPNNIIYQRRLNTFKRFLFDYVYNLERPCGKEIEKSGSLPIFLFDYLKMVQILKATAQAIPSIHGEMVPNFVPLNAMQSIKINLNNIIGFELTPIIPSPGVIYENIRPMPDGSPGIMPLIIKNNKNEWEIKPLHMKNSQGTFAIAPHLISAPNGKSTIGTKVPVYLLTETDAESIGLALANPRLKNSPRAEKIKAIEAFINNQKNLSNQAHRILACAMYNISNQTITEIVEAQNTEIKFEAIPEDKKTIQNCCFGCPHILPLKVFQQRLINLNRNFLIKQPDGTMRFSHAEGNLFNEIHEYLKVYTELEAEYSILYKRVQEEIKSIKRNRAQGVVENIEDEVESIAQKKEPVLAIPEPKPLPRIKYSNRVLRWFKNNFVNKQKKSSVLYHALLPLFADPQVVAHGQQTFYSNKTYIGQKDNHYSIPGKIIDETNNQESFCVFKLCLDPKGVCYHRECSKCTWENLNPELLKSCNFEEEAYIEDDEKAIEGDKASIISETQFSTTINNPRFKYKIILYKKQF
jgi:hypothetical protein